MFLIIRFDKSAIHIAKVCPLRIGASIFPNCKTPKFLQLVTNPTALFHS